ncbi:hypothetical protein ACHAQA_006700 [Verticillium albo-atrum]
MAAVEDAPVASGHKSDKKQRKEKKKRSREDDPLVTDERKHKRSKSTANRAVSPDLSTSAHTDANDSVAEVEKPAKKSSKKSKKSKQDGEADDAVQEVAEKKKRRQSRSKDDEDLAEVRSSAKKSSSSSKKKSKKQATPESSEAEQASESSASSSEDDDENPDAMDVDVPLQANAKSTSRLHQPLDTPAKPRYPFFTQTVSLFLPIYPIGWAGPCTAAATQHLQPMVNRYVPILGGVLLGFRNVAVSERPGREDAATDDSDACDLASIDEFAVGFGWVTADVDLFVPKRGAWMEGSINLESEGHVGVVCWGKFNASIESARLPPEWRWVHDEAATSAHDDTVSNFTAEEQHGAVRQIHATGYWVDAAGQKIKGRVRFRIKSFDVGVSGDHGYLSLEGTMLDAAGEIEARQRDAQQEMRRRKGKSGGVLRKERRHVPEFSVTKFGEVEDEEEKALAQEVWEHTEPAKDVEETAQEGEYAGITHESA